jgi:UDP-N-acetylmuramoyl-L-alanyl-D-glutamate--2,6-diaminopimelate ligase
MVAGGPERPVRPPFGWAEDFFTVGVTGTNGKTSTVHLLAAAFGGTGEPRLLLSTTGYYVDDDELGLPHTDFGFYESFRRAHARKVRRAAVEVTSKALSEGYAKKWRFDCGVFTNLSPDHLATHGSYEHYLASKAQLFVHLGPRCTAVINATDEHALFLHRAIPRDVKRLWYGSPTRGDVLHATDLEAAKVVVESTGTRVELQPSPLADALGGALQIQLVGAVFAENALAAAGAALVAGVDGDAVVDGMAKCRPVPGRFEAFGRDPVVIVDYAHTPDALARTCDQARQLATGRLVVVFGAGGESTPAKRRPMGAAVGERADLVIVTNDNPRKEDPRAIADAVAGGVAEGGAAQVEIELDRERAIRRAFDGAGPGDVVLVAGKGHETGQIIGDETRPFSDRDLARALTQ